MHNANIFRQTLAGSNTDRALKARVMGIRGKSLPPLGEIQHAETDANRAFDHAQLNLADGHITAAEIDAAEASGNAQIVQTESLLAKLESLRAR